MNLIKNSSQLAKSFNKIIKTAYNLINYHKNRKNPWWDEKCEKAVNLRHHTFKSWTRDKTENTYIALSLKEKSQTN